VGNEKLTILCAGLQAVGLGVGGGGSIGDRWRAGWRTLWIGKSLGHHLLSSIDRGKTRQMKVHRLLGST
jgi:hypothetical protein